jgi:hypothetical protein
MTTWHLDVDRVRISGVNARGVDAAALRPIVEQAVRAALETGALPAGRTVNASVEIRVPRGGLSSVSAIASAVGRGVANAARGAAHG